MEVIRDPEEKMLCPYVPAHYILKTRMNTHLVKCKKHYDKDIKLVECDFNVSHRVPEQELQYHHENCVDRKKIEITIYQEQGTVINKFPVQVVQVESDESWDHLNIKSYNPKEYCAKNEIIQHLDVAPAGARKNFRISERHRISQLGNNKPVAKPVPVPLFMKNGNDQSVSSRMNLPQMPSCSLKEDTPDSVAELMTRIKLGKNKSFVAKQV